LAETITIKWLATMLTKIETDNDAFRRAIDILRADPVRKLQIKEMLAEQSFIEVGQFAAYSCQCRSLGLKPWQTPPCWIEDDDPGVPDGPDFQHWRQARDLARRLLKAGLSKYEPDPIEALERAKGRKRVRG
jgi:hypothetical protein